MNQRNIENTNKYFNSLKHFFNKILILKRFEEWNTILPQLVISLLIRNPYILYSTDKIYREMAPLKRSDFIISILSLWKTVSLQSFANTEKIISIIIPYLPDALYIRFLFFLNFEMVEI